MRIVIDECIDERFLTLLSGHDCQTVRYAGLAGRKNGELLKAAEEAKSDAFLTWIKASNTSKIWLVETLQLSFFVRNQTV
jgi:hypothetical protein